MKINNENGESNNEMTPYEIGKKYGRCGTQVLFNLPFNAEDDIIIPIELRMNKDVKQGIMDGVKEIYDMLSALDKQMKSKE